MQAIALCLIIQNSRYKIWKIFCIWNGAWKQKFILPNIYIGRSSWYVVPFKCLDYWTEDFGVNLRSLTHLAIQVLARRTFRFWHSTVQWLGQSWRLCDKQLDTVGCIAMDTPRAAALRQPARLAHCTLSGARLIERGAAAPVVRCAGGARLFCLGAACLLFPPPPPSLPPPTEK